MHRASSDTHRFVRLIGFAAPASVLVSGALLACSSDGVAVDAQALQKQVEAIDIFEPPAERRKGVNALRALPLETEEARVVRETCVMGHDALLSAEQDSEEVRTALSRKKESELSPKEHEKLIGMLDRSDASIEKARGLLDQCREGVAKLVIEHPMKRGS